MPIVMSRMWLIAATVAVGLALPQTAQAFGPVGDDFQISFIDAAGRQSEYTTGPPRVAYNSTANEYLVVWTRRIGGGAPRPSREHEIFAQRVSATGALLSGPIQVSQTDPKTFGASSPSVAYGSGANEYFVVWTGDSEIFGQRLTASGAETGVNDVRLSDYSGGDPSVAYNAADNEYLVTWTGNDNEGEDAVFGQRVTVDAEQVGNNDFPISEQLTYGVSSPSVAFNAAENEYLVVWVGDYPVENEERESEIWAQRLDRMGNEVGGNDFRVSATGPDGDPSYGVDMPSVAYDPLANQYLVTWSGEEETPPVVDDYVGIEIFGQLLTEAGVEVGYDDFQISAAGPDYEARAPSVVHVSAENQFLVTWALDEDAINPAPPESEVSGQLLTTAGSEVGCDDFPISRPAPWVEGANPAPAPSVAYNSADNEAVVAWSSDDTLEIFGHRLGEPSSADDCFGAETLVTIRFSARRISARGPLEMRIRNRNDFAVNGTLSGRTARKVTVSGRRRLRLRAKAFSVAPDAKKTVKLKLPRPLRRVLRRKGKLRLRLTAKVEDPAGNTRTVRKTVTVRLKA